MKNTHMVIGNRFEVVYGSSDFPELIIPYDLHANSVLCTAIISRRFKLVPGSDLKRNKALASGRACSFFSSANGAEQKHRFLFYLLNFFLRQYIYFALYFRFLLISSARNLPECSPFTPLLA
jgi:hypothetical protein